MIVQPRNAGCDSDHSQIGSNRINSRLDLAAPIRHTPFSTALKREFVITISSTSKSKPEPTLRLQAASGWRRVIGVAVLLAFLLPAVAGAVEYTAARKAGRGLAGLTCGFLEIPGNIVKETQAHGAAQGFSLGFTLGLGHAVLRTLVGAFELVTSPFPVPEGFKPVIEPEFPWGYFDESKP